MKFTQAPDVGKHIDNLKSIFEFNFKIPEKYDLILSDQRLKSKKSAAKAGDLDRQKNQNQYIKNASLILDYFVHEATQVLEKLLEIKHTYWSNATFLANGVQGALDPFINPAAYYLDPNGFMPHLLNDETLYLKAKILEDFLKELLALLDKQIKVKDQVKDLIEMGFGLPTFVKRELNRRLNHLTTQIKQYESNLQNKSNESFKKLNLPMWDIVKMYGGSEKIAEENRTKNWKAIIINEEKVESKNHEKVISPIARALTKLSIHHSLSPKSSNRMSEKKLDEASIAERKHHR